MGDDLEKFGVWPGTNKLCYTDGWLENLFVALEQNSDWLETATPAAAVASHPSFGRADLPAASYSEMMEWALPTAARNRYHSLSTEFAARTEMLPFLRGGIWRNFFSKYGESNLLHKKMLHVSTKVRKLFEHPHPVQAFRDAREQARTLTLRGQCNDPYWHGVFGGLYSPHLRTELWRSLIQAEAIADALANPTGHYQNVATMDFDSDGRDEIYFTSDRYAAVLCPADGATISALDCRQSNAALVNSLARRPESYHAKLKNLKAGEARGAQSIHEQTRAKETGLDRWLKYDRWARHCFRLLVFGRDKKHPDCGTAQLAEDPALAGGNYRATKVSPMQATLLSEASMDWTAEKTFSFANSAAGFGVLCEVALRRAAAASTSVFVGIEAVLNFLAPSAHDRYFESAGARQPLRWSAVAPGSNLRVVDEWQGVSVTLTAPHAQEFWITPIETVSESEEGFERIYQGSQIIAVWPIEVASGAEWRGQLNFNVARLT
jgi:alpha-amylase